MRGQSRTEIAQKEPAHGFQWNGEGHPYAIPREQAQVKLEDRRAQTECQIREERGHHAPNHGVMETSSKDCARTSHLAGRCRVEKQAPVEQVSEEGDCHRREGQRVDRKRARQECPASTWTTRKSDRPITQSEEEPWADG